MTHSLLLEIGCEELPASFVKDAVAALPLILQKKLEASRISYGALRSMGSPRRLAIVVEQVAARQPDIEEEVTGPPWANAFDSTGKPTKAAEAFAKKYAVEISALRSVETAKGKYVGATHREQGRPTIELLPKLLVEAIAEIPFRKSMRWGNSDVAFGRPIHWIVAMLGTYIIPLSFAGVISGKTSYGHRFLASHAIEIQSPEIYEQQLEQAHVFVSIERRKERMIQKLNEKAKEVNGQLIQDDFLVEENVGLVEEPFVVAGTFDYQFLINLPEQLIVNVMRTHQRYFAVHDQHSHLINRYLAVVNTANDPERIIKGNDRVLHARLSDAKFFVATDRRIGLHAYAERLSGIRYHAKLGSYADKTKRIKMLALAIAQLSQPQHTELHEHVIEAALLCKADLASLTVGEFPEMQGHLGYDIASSKLRTSGVAIALANHWFDFGDSTEQLNEIGLYVGLADKFDHLIGGFAVGLAPTGGNDPFSIRRAFTRAVGAYLIAQEKRMGGSLPSLYTIAEQAYKTYAEIGPALPRTWADLIPELIDFMKKRLVGLFDASIDAGGPLEEYAFAGKQASRDVVQACIEADRAPGMHTGFDDLQDLIARIRAVHAARATDVFARLAIAFKRADKITKDVVPYEPNPSLFEHPSEKALWQAYVRVRNAIAAATEQHNYETAIATASMALAEPIDTFFDKDRGVFVMTDNLSVRENRLRMLATLAATLNRIAKLSQLAIG